MSINFIKDFWNKHDVKILVVLAIFLTAAVSFQAGKTQEKGRQTAEINISANELVAANPAAEKVKILGETLERKGVDLSGAEEKSGPEKTSDSAAAQNANCALVGSKNSDKYHLPSCSSAARIKSENRVCFSSEEEARSKGYTPAKSCFK